MPDEKLLKELNAALDQISKISEQLIATKLNLVGILNAVFNPPQAPSQPTSEIKPE